MTMEQKMDLLERQMVGLEVRLNSMEANSIKDKIRKKQAEKEILEMLQKMEQRMERMEQMSEKELRENIEVLAAGHKRLIGRIHEICDRDQDRLLYQLRFNHVETDVQALKEAVFG